MTTTLAKAPSEPLFESGRSIPPTPQLMADDGSENTVSKLISVTWKYLAAAAVVSAIAAAYWAKENSKNTYEVESRLVFNRSSVGAPLYQSPDVHTLATEFKSRDCLESLREEMGLKVPADLLERRLKTSVGRGNASLNLSLTWENVDDGKRLLNKVVSLGNRRSRSIRDEGIDQYVSGIRQTISTRYEPDHQTLVDRTKRHSATHGVDDVQASVDAMKQEIASLQDSIREEEINLQSRLSYRDTLDDQDTVLVSHTQPSTQSAIRASTPQTPTLSNPSSMIRRMDEIKLDIDRERNRAIAESRLSSKEGELARLRRLADSKLIPRSRYEAMLGEVEQLRLAVRGNSPMQAMETELDQLTSQVKSLGNDPTDAIEAVRELERKRDEIDQQVATSRIRIEQLEKLVNATTPKLEQLEAALPTAKELEKQLLVATKRVEDQSILAENLENLKGTDAHVFTVLSDAQPTIGGESSNYRKQFAGAFLLAFLGLSTPALVFGFKSVVPKPGESLAKNLGVVTLASPSLDDLPPPADATDQVHPESIRLLANRLRRLATDESIIQILELTGRQPSLWLTRRIGDCLAQLGDKVTIVIAGAKHAIENHSHQGLLQTIEITETNDEQILARVKDCAETGRLTLITGLDRNHFAEVELLGLQVDGVILSAPGGQRIDETSQGMAISLAQYRAPILGVVT